MRDGRAAAVFVAACGCVSTPVLDVDLCGADTEEVDPADDVQGASANDVVATLDGAALSIALDSTFGSGPLVEALALDAGLAPPLEHEPRVERQAYEPGSEGAFCGQVVGRTRVTLTGASEDLTGEEPRAILFWTGDTLDDIVLLGEMSLTSDRLSDEARDPARCGSAAPEIWMSLDPGETQLTMCGAVSYMGRVELVTP